MEVTNVKEREIDLEIKGLIRQADELEKKWEATDDPDEKLRIQRKIDVIDRKVDRLEEKRKARESECKPAEDGDDDEVVEYEPGKFIKRKEYDWLRE